jgi:hypothetical protein
MSVCFTCEKRNVGLRTLFCSYCYKKNYEAYTNIQIYTQYRNIQVSYSINLDSEDKGYLLHIKDNFFLLLKFKCFPAHIDTFFGACIMVQNGNIFQYWPTTNNRLNDIMFQFCEQNKILSCQGIWNTRKTYSLWGLDPKDGTKEYSKPQYICVNKDCKEIWNTIKDQKYILNESVF